MPRVAVSTAIEEVAYTGAPLARGHSLAAVRETLVVIGNGMAGHRLCRRLLDHGEECRYQVVVFGEEPIPAYDRVHLTDVFGGRRSNDLLLSPLSWYAEHGVDLRLDDQIVEIDRSAHLVRAASGAVAPYNVLVFATGSSPYVPPIDGASLSNVFRYRTIRDAWAIRERAHTARTAAVIGGGLLGLEAARALQHMGLELVIIEAAAAVMPTQLDQAAGKELERQIATLGIRVETAAMTKRIEADGTRRKLVFADGTSVVVDMVIVAAGVRPRTELAAGCGLRRSPNGGIVVDDQLRTSDPDICAIGECASYQSQMWGLVAPAYAMADTLADNLLGRSSRFLMSAPPTRLKLLDVEVATAGEPLERGVTLRFQSSGIYRRLRVERGRLVGALGVGTWPEFSRIHDATNRQQRIWPWQMARFQRTGTLWRAGDSAASDWPSDAIVCNCLSVTRDRIAAACASGTATVEAVVHRTGASTLCGSCRPLIAELVGVPAAATPEGRAWGLLGASATAMVIALLIAVATPVPFSSSVQDAMPLDVLWRHGAVRQTTGFCLIGLSLMASLLTLRKRWRRVSIGAFATWRATHAIVGMLTLVALAAHTGFRLGENANFVLMASFGALNVVGAVAGGVTALERASGASFGARCRRVLVTAHIAALWPLPLLIGWHVVSVYYF